MKKNLFLAAIIITVLTVTLLIRSKTGAEEENNVIWLVKPQFDWANSFFEGMGLIKEADKWGYINKEGKIIIEPQFDIARNFSEGLALVGKDTKWGFINKEGKFVIKPQFDRAGSFHEGLAEVSKGNKWGYINKNGKYVVEPQLEFQKVYVYPGTFSEGIARVQKNGKFGFINRYGKFVIEPQFENASHFSEGVVSVQKVGKYGFIKSPIPAQKQEQAFTDMGLYIGTIQSVSAMEVVVGGRDIAERVYMGDKLCLYSGDNLIIIRSTFPMQTITKCEVVTGSIKDIKPGMKVYRYRKIRLKNTPRLLNHS